MAALRRAATASLTVLPDQPLIGVPAEEEGREVTRYFTDEAAADAALEDEGVQQALSVIGAWSHLDWDQAVQELDRIRHESTPTPPIEPL
jgi:hypothetical protein